MPTFLLALLSYPLMAAQFSITRLGLAAGLTVWDIAMLRYSAAALGAAFVFSQPARRALVLARPERYVAVALLGGALYGAIFALATGLMPASHATLFAPSSSIICTLVLAGLLLGAWPSRARLVGIAVILLGLVVFARAAGAQFDWNALSGDLLFLLVGLMWGSFSVLARKWSLDPLCCVATMGATGILAVPAWFIFAPSGLSPANLPIAFGEALFQGLVLTFVTFLTYITLVHRLGPSTAALGIAAVPPLGVVIASVLLGESTRSGQWVGAAIVVAGLVVASGAKLGRLRQSADASLPGRGL